MIRSNLHTHTTFCDGRSTAREMIEAALARGFVSLGFSSHSPLDGASWTMQDEDGYRAQIRALAQEYRDRIEIFCGVEWDADSADSRAAYDYAISSVHCLHAHGGVWGMDDSPAMLADCIRDGYAGDAYAMCEAYFAALTAASMRVGADVIGHFDVCTKYNADGRFFDEEHPRYRTAALTALDTVCTGRPDAIFECNVGGMVRAGRHEPYPPLWALRYLRERGMRVTLTSDAHTADLLDAGFDDGIEFLRAAGYRSVVILQNGKFTECGIE